MEKTIRRAVMGATEGGTVTHKLRPFDPEEPMWRRTVCSQDLVYDPNKRTLKFCSKCFPKGT